MRRISFATGIKSLTFLTPTQDSASGGPYVIQTLAQKLASVFRVNLVVLHSEPKEVDGVHVFHSPYLRSSDIPDADAIVLYADAVYGGHFAQLPASKGTKFCLFMGYGPYRNPNVISNLRRNFPVIAIANWLVAEAKSYGCSVAYTRGGIDRAIFHHGGADRNRNLVAMMTHPLIGRGPGTA